MSTETGSKKKKLIIGLSIAAGAVVIVVATIIILFNSRIFSGNNGKIINQEVKPTVVDEKGDEIVLDPETLAKKQETFLVVGLDESEMLTDVIMLVSFDYEKMDVNVLQIPRDTYVRNGTAKTGKINSAYYAGDPELSPINRLIYVINDQYKIKVDHYVTVNIASFRNCVDAIGGVPINIPYDIGNEELGIIFKGEQVLDGEHAEWLVRHRHTYVEGDIGRVKIQRLFMAALIQKIKTLGMNEMLSLVPVLSGEFTTDLTVNQITEYVKIAMQLDMSDITMYILPGEGVMYENQSVWSMHLNETADLLNMYFRPYTAAVTAEELNIEELAHTGEYYENTEDDLQSIIDTNSVGGKNNDGTLPTYTHVVTQPSAEETPDIKQCTFTYNPETGAWDMTDNGEDYVTGPLYYIYDENDSSWHIFNSRDLAEEYLDINEMYIAETSQASESSTETSETQSETTIKESEANQ